MPKVELLVEEGDKKTYEVSVREVNVGGGGGGGSTGCLLVIVVAGMFAVAASAMAMF